MEGDGFYGIKISQHPALQRDAAPGTCRSASSGSRPPGWPPASSSDRWSAATSRSSSALGVHVLFGALLVIVVGLAGRRMVERPEQALRRQRVPLGPPGLRVRRPRPRLADPAVRRTADLAVPGGPRHPPGARRQRGEHSANLLWLFLLSAGRHRPVLRRGPDLGPAHASVDRGILALVGGPPLGGRLLRSLRHHRDRLLLHAPRPDPPGASRRKSALLSATIFLSGGIIGTCHHLYFSGTPTVALAWGSVFSALEVVPLTHGGLLRAGRPAARHA